MKEKTLRNIGATIASVSILTAIGLGGKLTYNYVHNLPEMNKETVALNQSIYACKERISQLSKGIPGHHSVGLFESDEIEKLPAGLPEEYLRFVHQSRSNELAILNSHINSATQNPAYVDYQTALKNSEVELSQGNLVIGYLASICSGLSPIFFMRIKKNEKRAKNT